MRFAAFLLVLAVALGAFLVLRTPAGEAPGVSPDAGATPAAGGSRPLVDLVRGGGAPTGRSQIAPAAPPPSAAKEPAAAILAGEKNQAGQPPALTAVEALPSASLGIDDAGLTQKYEKTTPDQRRQALATIRQQLEFTPLDAKEVGMLKNELEWLERSLEG